MQELICRLYTFFYPNRKFTYVTLISNPGDYSIFTSFRLPLLPHAAVPGVRRGLSLIREYKYGINSLTHMDQQLLKHSLSSLYIPERSGMELVSVPKYHPCLIVQDMQTDVTKVKPCGCADSYCVTKAPEWIPRAKR